MMKSLRKSADRGSMSLEQTVIIALLVLVAASTALGLGQAIACKFSQQAAVTRGEYVVGCVGVPPLAALGNIRIAYVDTAADAVAPDSVTVSGETYTPRTPGTSANGGTYTYVAASPGYYPETVTVPTDSRGVPVPPVVVFRPVPIDFTITALDRATDAPLVSGTVTMADSLGALVPDSPRVTNAQGEAVLGISKTDTYTVTASKAGYATEVSTVFVKVGGAVIPRRAFTVTAAVAAQPAVTTGTLVITTLNWHGNPAWLRVVITGPNAYFRDQLYSNALGILTVPDLAAGSYQVKTFQNPASTKTAVVTIGGTVSVEVSQRS